jgi:hypothetical protein
MMYRTTTLGQPSRGVDGQPERAAHRRGELHDPGGGARGGARGGHLVGPDGAPRAVREGY